ncbi:lysophospholipid acyltransferase family protein [bacterium]|nr:lysophospholipid acyltransferase family protein [bacterium]
MLLAAVTGMARAVPLQTGYRFADACSEIHRWASPSRRRAVEANLRALGVGNPSAHTPAVYRNFGRSLFEFLRGPHLPEIPVRFDGWEHLQAALAKGRGAVVAAPHTGNWGQAAAEVTRLGHPVAAVAGIQLSRSWTPALRERQQAGGIHILPPTVASWRAMPRLLLEGQYVLALLVDGDVFRGGLECEVDGRGVRFPMGPAKLAIRTGAPLLTGWVLRDPDGGTRVGFGPEIEVDPGRPDEVARVTRVVLGEVLAHLRRHPDQWLLFRRFFHDALPSTAAPAHVPAALEVAS